MPDGDARVDNLSLLCDSQWKALDPFDKSIHSPGHVSSPGTCHPAEVLEAISKLRLNPHTDAVSRNATVCVDVGDITLVGTLNIVSTFLLCLQYLLLRLFLNTVGVLVSNSGGWLSNTVFGTFGHHGLRFECGDCRHLCSPRSRWFLGIGR